MAKPLNTSKGDPDQPNNIQYIYRGHTISVEYHPEHDHRHLNIDGVRIHYEITAGGVHSHDSMFQHYGSPYELAEDLIKQWGETELKSGEAPPPHNHPQ
jgi:hypothetical protein